MRKPVEQMTNEQSPITWAQLTPAQRDRLVAEKVMDWQSTLCHPEPYQVVLNLDGYRCYKCGKHAPAEGNFYNHLKEIPSFTTSMDAAWQIVEKLGNFDLMYASRSPYPCTAVYVRIHAKEKPGRATAKTMTEAICIAALRCVRVEIDTTTEEKIGHETV